MNKYVLGESVTARSQAAMLSMAFVIPATLWRSFSQLFVHTVYTYIILLISTITTAPRKKTLLHCNLMKKIVWVNG